MKKCRIYYNLHRKCWSVQQKIPGRGWIVVDHASEVFLEGVTFQVSEAGRQRVLRTRRKNVHAWGIGDRFSVPSALSTIMQWGEWEPVSYNPYRFSHFYRTLPTGLCVPIQHAKNAHFRSDRTLFVVS